MSDGYPVLASYGLGPTDVLNSQARSGDLLLLEGRGLWHSTVRVLTGQSVSHVAMLVRVYNRLEVVEVAPGGFSRRALGDWLDLYQAKGRVYYGKAPYPVRGHPALPETAMAYEGHGYSWVTLAKVWVSQIAKFRPAAGLVCSTFVQECWEACGFRAARTLADPGDFLRHCEKVRYVPHI